MSGSISGYLPNGKLNQQMKDKKKNLRSNYLKVIFIDLCNFLPISKLFHSFIGQVFLEHLLRAGHRAGG